MTAELDLLRRAETLMRERAEGATPGPWEVLWNAVAYVDTIADPNDLTGQTPMQSLEKVADAGERDREHIASWHPAVALAVAETLAQHILEHETHDCLYDPCAHVALARTYLNEKD